MLTMLLKRSCYNYGSSTSALFQSDHNWLTLSSYGNHVLRKASSSVEWGHDYEITVKTICNTQLYSSL